MGVQDLFRWGAAVRVVGNVGVLEMGRTHDSVHLFKKMKLLIISISFLKCVKKFNENYMRM